MATIDLEIDAGEEKYINTVKDLRLRDFNDNLPFLILSEKLPEGQVYQEFKDGHIELHEVSTTEFGFKVLRTLTAYEDDQVRKDYGLF